MPEDSSSERWTPVPSTAADWLRKLCDDDGVTGFLAPPLPDAAWVLNAMYEHERGPVDVSYHEHRQALLAAGRIAPRSVAGIDLEVGIATGGGLGRAEHPGHGWRRLRWAQLARRTGDPVVPEGLLPSRRCFPSARKDGSWPLHLAPPTEGSLDRETWNRLVRILTAYSPAGPDTRCFAYDNPLMRGYADFDELHVRTGLLRDAEAIYDRADPDFSPSNLWPEDRSWVLCTDYDLWGTKVAGPPALVEALLTDPELEALRLPWAP
ncbi:hypothetical protein AB0O91_00760 [Kitasatospora sp. NPDC089797]|uniref:hypothetical protein n=1 Tax=Kitasatospora sp. NPDC089797 TaxID=3155298 RepID=UPI00342A1639